METMVKAYKQKVFNGQMPVFDGRKNLYSRDPLPIGREKVRNNFLVYFLLLICHVDTSLQMLSFLVLVTVGCSGLIASGGSPQHMLTCWHCMNLMVLHSLLTR